MKTTKNIFPIALALLTGLTITSCRQTNDWETSGSYPRLFAPNNKTTITASDITAEVTFTGVPKASYYVIEVSTDSLYDDIAEGGTPHSIVFGRDKSIVKSPTTITGLDGDTKYFFRIKAVTDGINDSKWSYLAKNTFKTLAEQIFVPTVASDRAEDQIRVAWDATKAVSHLIVKSSDEDEQTITLDDAAKAAGEYTITGLTPTTSYTITIMNGEAVRGQLIVSTTAAMPAADFKYTLPDEVTTISPELLEEIATQAKAAAEAKGAPDFETNYSATIGIPAEATIDFHGTSESDGSATNVKIPEGMSLTFFGLAGGEAPTIKFQKNIELGGSHALIAFENVKVVNDGAGYFVNQSNECNIAEFKIKDCEMSGFGTSFFRFQKSNPKNIEKIAMTNSIFHDMCAGYSFFHIDADKGKGGGVKNISMENCTLYNVATGGKMFIYSRETEMESIIIKNVTFYNCIGGGNYWVDFGNNTTGTTGEFSFTNCIFAKTPDEATNKNIRALAEPNVVGCFSTSDFFKNIKGSEKLEKSAADIFVDPANADFHFKTGEELNAGDPRWFTIEQ
jgi:hypothetical protein